MDANVLKTRVLYRARIARSYATQQRNGAKGAGVSQTRAEDDSENKEENESTGIGLKIEVPDFAFYFAFATISDGNFIRSLFRCILILSLSSWRHMVLRP